jgi:hypothetical protein
VLVPAAAEATVKAQAAPTNLSAPPRAAAITRWYATIGLSLGGATEPNPNEGGILLVHGALGLERGHQDGVVFRVGPSIGILSAYTDSFAAGLESQVDYPVIAGWRLGGRGSLSIARQKRAMWIAGVRARHRVVSLGVDVIGFGPNAGGTRGHAVGMMGTLGLEGRAGKYGLGLGLAGGAIIMGLTVLALAGTH